MVGEIVRLVGDKGFGFIRGDADGVERFFHRSALDLGMQFHDLREGQRVEFDEEPGQKGPRAGNVRAA